MATNETNPVVINQMAAQGDLLIRRVSEVPSEFVAQERKPNELVILAHSETGHHHAINAADVIRYEGGNPLICYLSVDAVYADVVHHRSFDTHATIRLTPGKYQVRRAREYTPEGWRRVAD